MKRPGRFTYLLLAVLLACLFSESAQGEKKKTPPPPPPPPPDPLVIDALSSPFRIAFGPGGTLLVADYDLQMVVFVDPLTNTIKGGFRVAGSPLGVLYATNKIFVGNLSKRCVSVYSETGTWLKDIAPGSVPSDLAVDLTTDRLFVLDSGARAIKIFALNGGEGGAIPASFPDPAVLTMPTAIAWDPGRLELLVSDYGGDIQVTAPDGTTTTTTIYPRIQIFDSGGNLAGTISSYKASMMGGTYRFSRPQGLQADSQGGILLTDCYSGEVLIFSRATGLFLKALGGYGTDPGKMRLPLDLVIDETSKDVFVTNNMLKRIEIFRQGAVY